MNLFTFKNEPHERWTFQINAYGTVGFVKQYKTDTSPEWEDCHSRCFEIAVWRKFRWGFDHRYYDGPHCSLFLGFIQIVWGGGLWSGNCRKCMPDDWHKGA